MEDPVYQCTNVVTGSKAALNLSRHELIDWINETLRIKLKSVEELCSGAIYCQLMDRLFPGCISLKKIRFAAYQEHEKMSNLKWLQVAFRKVGCDKHVPIDRLIKGRFQENFEFLQWFKRFYDANTDSAPIVSATCLIPTVAFDSESTPGRVLRSQTPSSVFSSQTGLSVFPSLSVSRVPKVTSSHVKPKVISSADKRRVPSTDVKLRVPSTDVKRRVPSTDVKRRVPSTDVKRRVLSSNAKRRGPSTEAKPKRIGTKTQLCSSGASTQSAAASMARQKQEENELKTKIAELEEITEELKRKNKFYLHKLKKINALCSKETQDADVDLNKEELISQILAELQATEEDYGPEVEEDDHETY